MRLMIASRNRLAALGLRTLSEAAGFVAELVPMDQIRQGARGADVTLLYADRWDEDLQEVLEALRASHLRFIVVLGQCTAADEQAVLSAGALYAFERNHTETLALALTNYRWSFEQVEDLLMFTNGFGVDLPRRRLLRGGRYLNLTMTECQFLSTLHRQAREHPGRAVSLPEICLAVWGFPDARSPTTVRGYISQLRAKLEVQPEQPAVLLSRRGRGYWLVLAD
jgi:two-component system KDP operon response regulator KdpE